MKVGILSESDADEAGIRILAEAVLGFRFEILEPIRLRSRGWASVLTNLPAFYKALHWRPDADGLIVVLDSDDTPIHSQAHEHAGSNIAGCRCCEMQRRLHDLRRFVTPRKQSPLKVAIGFAVPAIEAWYLCGVDVHSTEARFAREPSGSLYNLRRDLKREAYGSVAPPVAVMKARATEHCQRLAGSLSLLEQHFPSGFGILSRSLRQWIEPDTPPTTSPA
jgi:hypothetical protein